MDYDEEIVQEFLVESYEMLDTLDESFVALEERPDDKNVLGAIFRVMHTIKGSSAFLGFARLEELCHKGENLLSLLRDGEMSLTVEIADALLSTVDGTRRYLARIEEDGVDQGVDVRELIDELVRLANADHASHDEAVDSETGAASELAAVGAASVAEGSSGDEVRPSGEAAVGPVEGDEQDRSGGAAAEPDDGEGAGSTDDDAASPGSSSADRVGDILVADHGIERTDVEIAAAEQSLGDSRPIGEILTAGGEVGEQQLDAALDQQAQQQAQPSGGKRSAADSTIRVDVDLLDDLMNLVGELVLTRNEILQYITDTTDGGLALSSQRLDLLTSELQDKVMTTRMQSIGGLFNKFPRVVRDLAHQCGKQIRLEMEGKETELDKSLIESIKDPLTHLVRNTVDHGIEPPEVREAAGKPAEGVLRIAASHQDGHVVITIADDGGGINLDKVKAKALERNLVTREALASMSDGEAVNLIFLPGFSTADKVTTVSGRGVGMDVVRTNIEKIGGSVEIKTERGAGTTFRIEIPLTLAIVPALVILCAGRRYAIPQRSLVELVSVDGTENGHAVEFIHDAPVIRLRDRLLPVVDLRKVLEEDGRDGMVGDMVVLTADGGQFSLLVDEIVETQEIVVKPLGEVVHGVEMFSGATILGDGQVALILDVVGLGQDAHVFNGRGDGPSERSRADEVRAAGEGTSEPLLLLSMGGERQVAIALSEVERLDEFESGALEMSGHRQVVQYRSEIMPLLDLASELGYGTTYGADDRERVSVVVYRHSGRDVGLVIDEMIDIVDYHQTEQTATGNLIIQGRVTEMVDVSRLPSLEMLEHEFRIGELS